MSPEITRPTLLSRVRDPADQAAWAEFESRYRELIFLYCRRSGLETADAEDVRQLVMVRLLRVLPQFRYDPATGRFHDYLFRVIRSAISDYRACPGTGARAVLREKAWTPESMSTPSPADDEAWEQEWLDHHLRMALETVRRTTEERNVAIFERLLAGASVEQAAEEFGISTDAVHKIKQRTRDRVQECIAAQIREENGHENEEG